MITRILLCIALVLIVHPSFAAAEDEIPTLDAISTALDDSTSLQGNVVYVDFWASWCAPCRTSFPWMQQMQEAHGEQGLTIITISVDRKPESADKFIADLGVELPVINDPKGELAERFSLQAMPTAFVFDRTGTLKLRHEGFRPQDAETLETLLVELLAEGPATPADEMSKTTEMAP